jgi:hypothetical protein
MPSKGRLVEVSMTRVALVHVLIGLGTGPRSLQR